MQTRQASDTLECPFCRPDFSLIFAPCDYDDPEKRGEQTVRVEHVQVYSGGQAIVGAVSNSEDGGRIGLRATDANLLYITRYRARFPPRSNHAARRRIVIAHPPVCRAEARRLPPKPQG